MPIMFNSILKEAGFPLENVRLLRHKDNRAEKGRTPYELWRDNRTQFDLYQSIQSKLNRPKLNADYWAEFVGTPSDETMFLAVYSVKYRGLLKKDSPKPHMDGVDKAGSSDKYDLTQQHVLDDLSGKLIIDWGPGALAWVQYAARRNKPVTELRAAFKEPEFPGFLNFSAPLSKIETLPKEWESVLRSSRGVYLLTCPKSKEQYVGSATGNDGFLGRWNEYIQTGHGGNVALKSRKLSDYHVSILEVAGTASTTDDVRAMESRWKDKLQSRAMGLNRN